MLVGEVKKIIKNYSDEQKDKIIIELYKNIPKGKREENNIDNFIINLTKEKKKENNISIEDLFNEIKCFLQLVDEGLYSHPNKIVNKKERSNWRFKVKRYYKELNKIPIDTYEGTVATDLLKDIYSRLSYGSCSLLFTNWETFRAVGISQDKMLENIIKRKLSISKLKEDIDFCVNLFNNDFDPYGSERDVINCFVNCFTTKELKEVAIISIKEKIEKLKNKKEDYWRNEYINYNVKCIFQIYMDMEEYELAIKYFTKNYIEKFKEIKMYILLNLIDEYELDDLWIKVYESNRIKYRDSLVEEYNKKIKKVGK